MRKEEKEPVEVPRVYSYQDLLKYANTRVYSSIGPSPLSNRPSLPLYSFGSGTRAAGERQYVDQDQIRIDCFGKATPQGFAYAPTDKFAFRNQPAWRIGSESRCPRLKRKYEHYQRKDIDIDLNESDRARRTSSPNTRLGLEARFAGQPKRFKTNPGPQYDPTLKFKFNSPPEYSLYSRRAIKGFDPLLLLTSTPGIVGPASYYPQNSSKTSKEQNPPTHVIGTGPKLEGLRPNWDLNQTYSNISSVGVQFESTRPSANLFSISRRKRETPAGIFVSHMENRPMKVVIKHPKY